MFSDESVQKFLDYLADLLSVVDRFPSPYNQLFAIDGYNNIYGQTCCALDEAWGEGEGKFFVKLKNFISRLKCTTNSSRFVEATTAAIWMDSKIVYTSVERSDHKWVSLFNLVPLGNGPVTLLKLNTNDRDSGIQLHPKFDVSRIFNKTTQKFEGFGNRDVYYGINGKLNHVSYMRYDEKVMVRNVVIPHEYIKGEIEGTLRIAFCPMSDQPKLLKEYKTKVPIQNILMDGRGVETVLHKEQLIQRFYRDVRLACKHSANIIFFPEMLGMQELEENCYGMHLNLQQLYEEMNSEIGKSIVPPKLVFFPTWWREGVNSTTVVGQQSNILGVQKKYIPYVNEKEHWIEALRVEDQKEILLIHLCGIHRIAVVICAEFPSLRDDPLSEVLLGSLGATLLLVPSFSKGEKDFTNSLDTLKDYGVTVVWGNCCGATRIPRVVGGCSIAGLDTIQRFGNSCSCNQSCAGIGACLFLVTLPLRLSRERGKTVIVDGAITHFTEKSSPST